MRDRIRRSLAGGALAAAALALVAGETRADILRLGNGKSLHGTVERGFVSEDALKVRLFSTGGLVRVRWEHLIAVDRERWQLVLGLKEPDEDESLKVDGHKVWFAGGNFRLGLIKNPDDLGNPDASITFVSEGLAQVFPRAALTKIEPARLDLPQVYTPEQAYEAKRQEMNPNNGYSHFDLAEYARKVGAYDRAKEHYLRAKEDNEFVLTDRGKTLDSRLANLEILLKNKALQERIHGVRNLLRLAGANHADFRKAAGYYQEAREQVARMMKDVQDKEVLAELHISDLAFRVEADRRVFFQRLLPVEVFHRLRRLFDARAKEDLAKDIPPGLPRDQKAILQAQGTFDGARQYASRQVQEDLWRSLLDDLGWSQKDKEARAKAAAAAAAAAAKASGPAPAAPVADPSESPFSEESLQKELLQFWKDRQKSGLTTTSYGYGTFIVEKPKLVSKKAAPAPQSGGRNQRQPARQIQNLKQNSAPPPKPITADEWWNRKETTAKEKRDWLLSYFAERAAFFEVVSSRLEPDEACGGTGTRTINVAATGETEQVLCTVCNGVGGFRKVKWR